jgi:hypothetical protein
MVSTVFSFLRFAFLPGGRLLSLAATLSGLGLPTVVAAVLGDWRLALIVASAALVLLFLIAGVRLQRILDLRPKLALFLVPDRTYSPAFHERANGGSGRYCSVWVSADKHAERCYGRIVACEHREGNEFAALPDFMGAVELAWPKVPLESEIDIEPDVPERLVVSVGLKDRARVYLGIQTGAVGDAIQLSTGEYRVKVRVGTRGWRAPDHPTDRWFRLSHEGNWDRVQLLNDQP